MSVWQGDPPLPVVRRDGPGRYVVPGYGGYIIERRSRAWRVQFPDGTAGFAGRLRDARRLIAFDLPAEVDS